MQNSMEYLSSLSSDELIHILLDGNVDSAARYIAAQLLGKRGSEEAQSALIQVKHEANADVARAADIALKRIFKSIVSETKRQRDSKVEKFSQELRLGSDHSRVLNILQDKSQPVESRIKACAVAGNLRVLESLPFLVDIISEGDQRLVWAAAHALIELCSRRATRGLIEIVRIGTNETSRHASIYVLGFLRDRRAEQILMRVLENHTGENSHTRSLAAEALGQISRWPKSQEALSKAVRDSSEEVSRSALCALKTK